MVALLCLDIVFMTYGFSFIFSCLHGWCTIDSILPCFAGYSFPGKGIKGSTSSGWLPLVVGRVLVHNRVLIGPGFVIHSENHR